MGNPQRLRAWLIVVVCAGLGLMLGVAAARSLTGREEGYTAQATLAMLPEQNIPLDQVAAFWEVLNRGQATASAAVVLEDDRWLNAAAAKAGARVSELRVSAGAMPNTTLITVTAKAGTPRTAEAALSSVLADAVGPAAKVSGPFRLETVVPPESSAVSLAPSRSQMFAALGIAGLLVGVGAGVLIVRSLRKRSTRISGVRFGREDHFAAAYSGTNGTDVTSSHRHSMVEITPR